MNKKITIRPEEHRDYKDIISITRWDFVHHQSMTFSLHPGGRWKIPDV